MKSTLNRPPNCVRVGIKSAIGIGIVMFAAAAGMASGVATAQTYPSKPVRVIVGYAPGGGMDAIARIVVAKLSEQLGQQFLVENRPGAAATLAADFVSKAPADGYTIHLAETGLLIAPTMYPKLSFDPVRSFTPIAGVASLPLAIVVNPSVPAKNAQELAAWLTSSPGRYSYGSPGVGSLQHLAMELWKKTIGADVIHVPYRGAGPMMPDIIGGQIPIGVISVAPALAQARSGKLRTIAVTSPARLPQAPDWPALAESVPKFEAAPRVFLIGPAGLSDAIVTRLADATRNALSSTDVLDGLGKQGASAQWVSSRDIAIEMAAESRKWGAIARDAGVRAE